MTSQELKEFLLDVKLYNKFGTFPFTINQEDNLKIVTSIDGQVETINHANIGDYILSGPKGENYVLTPEKFFKRYVVKDGLAKAIGSTYAKEYKGESFNFVAPWGEDMICNNGDYLATTVVGSDDIYRIEREVFHQTYKSNNESI